MLVRIEVLRENGDGAPKAQQGNRESEIGHVRKAVGDNVVGNGGKTRDRKEKQEEPKDTKRQDRGPTVQTTSNN